MGGDETSAAVAEAVGFIEGAGREESSSVSITSEYNERYAYPNAANKNRSLEARDLSRCLPSFVMAQKSAPDFCPVFPLTWRRDLPVVGES